MLILGGDITGKMIVPLVKRLDGTYKCSYAGSEHVLKSKEQIDEVLANIRDSGYCPYLTEPKEVEELYSKPELVHQVFVKLMKETLREWLKLAEERLRGTGISCYISPGNDDFFEIDEVLNSSSHTVDPEEKVINIDGEHDMITLGSTNHTPWNSPRGVDEDVLQRRIDKMVAEVRDIKKSIFNIHIPPINTLIDQAPKLDKNFKPVMSGGNLVMISAGSSAVRNSIEKYQPLIGIHGHIRESRGMVKIGKTMCFNPGSEYASGILKGLLCDIDNDSVKSYMLTPG